MSNTITRSSNLILKMPRIVFLPELSDTTGYGHFYRSVALMQMLETEFDTLLCLNRKFESKSPFPHRSFLYDVQYPGISEIMGQFDPINDVIVTDGYGVDARFQLKLKEHGFRTVRVDDFGGEVYSDLFINHAPNAKGSDYKSDRSTLLLGADYALLRGEYLKRAEHPAPAVSKPFKKVLLMFGGADPLSLGIKFNQLLGSESQVESVTTLGNYENNAIGNHYYKGNLSAEELIAELESADLVICAASTFFMELCCVGVPCLLVTFGDDQKGIADSSSKLGAAIYLGDMRQDEVDLTSAIARAELEAQTMIDAQKSLIDGKQAERIKKAFHELYA